MPDTTPDQAAIATTAALIRAIAGPEDNPDYEARARAYVLGAIAGADRIARSDTSFRREVQTLLAAYTAATEE